MKDNTRSVQFISLGPGGTDNVTLGVARTIGTADIIYCFGSHGISHCADTLYGLTDKNRISVIDIPMSKDRTKVLEIYNALAQQIIEEYRQDKVIAVATEGDTGIFATTHYVMDMLMEQGIPCSQSAGIPSFIGAGALAKLHLVKLSERLLVIPGETSASELASLICNGTNVVVMKLSMATEAVQECMNRHPEFHYHYFSNIGMENQEYINDIDTLKDMQYPYFSLMVIQL